MCAVFDFINDMEYDARDDLSERSFQFACDAYDYCLGLVQFGGLAARVGYQLFDAASSVGANRAEAKFSYSRREFAAKSSLCLKESREAHFWLRLAQVKSLGDSNLRTRLLHEAHELVSIYASSVKTLKAQRLGTTG